MDFTAILGAWIAVGLTLFILSFLYRDNPLFKIAENLYIGIAIGYIFSITIYNVWIPKIYQPVSNRVFTSLSNWVPWVSKFVTPAGDAGSLTPLFPAIIGISLLTRIFPKISWISRYGFAFIVGYGAGLAIPATVATMFIAQIEGTIQPVFKLASGGAIDLSGPALWTSFSAILLCLGVIVTLFYFFFSLEHGKISKKVTKIGIYFLMVYFGAAFGTTVMGRFALLYGRFFDLYTYRTSGYYHATPILILLVLIFFFVYFGKSRKTSP
ncbi:MAG: hypothetical protein HY746_04995 [Elusimicrobia bacterium]|nr:hypothetical protein [Elusimicrobiota bacterium]